MLPAPSRYLKLTIAYDGTDFHGWQLQPNAVTVQAELQSAARRFAGSDSPLRASGRTDAGVHAWGQVASWEYAGGLEPERVRSAFNGILPPAVRVRRVEEVAADFHARKSARAKTYLYVIDNGLVANPLLRRYAWHIRCPLELEALRRASLDLLGRHDFLSFKAADGETVSSERCIFQARWLRRGSLLLFFVRGSGFLKNMVRIMVGTLLEIGAGKYEPSHLQTVLAARDRAAAGITAPPQGLILRSVDY
ncbi:MAG: tRNA pseudouridine(38-40) synthase TruA [Deltaproteobacteria bacterium]|nr:tRNA pseudouridine(38-40) synthase TruA [Deltaproteobacteria bacterium]